MATLYPSTYPKAPNPEDPEFEVFEILKKLPDHYSVFYSKKFKGTKAWDEEREIDFIIFDGKSFLLCLEVKGGLIKYDGKEDKWYQNGERMKRQPDRQSASAMQSALAYLGPDAKNLNLGWALGFPNCCLPDNFQPPSGLPDPIIIDEKRFNHVQASIEAAGQYYVEQFGRSGISAATAASIISRLTKSIGFVTKVGVRIERDHQQLLEVTEEQYKVLEDLEINQRTIVRGFAGTGKTVLATEFAKRKELEGKKVLFLFYNRFIAKNAQRSFGRESEMTCTRFFKFAKSAIDKTDPDWWNTNYRKNDDSFWEEDVSLKLVDLPIDETDKFDVIIVDEGQDFKKDWFEFLEGLLVDSDESRFAVFYDEHQDVFGRWSDLPWGEKGASRKQLTENCRNTKSIINYLNDKRPTGMTPFKRSPEGEKVIERKVSSPEEAKAKFLEDISNVLSEGVDPGKVVVLLNPNKTESCLADVTKIGRMKFESISRYYNERSRSIQFTTINMFKGLEADVVFVVACEGYGKDALSEILYAQGSRARTLLYVYYLQ
jgi:hypothetical protein